MNHQQTNLFHTNWGHYIGGYYKNTGTFVREAKKYGFSRRTPSQIAAQMNFGDGIFFLRFYNPQSYFFATGEVQSLILPHEIASQVGETLRQQGKAEFNEGSGEGNGSIKRECGSYFFAGSWNVTATIPEIMEIAIKIASPPLFVMIGGKIIEEQEEPQLIPNRPFTRSFFRADSILDIGKENNGQIIGIGMYKKGVKK